MAFFNLTNSKNKDVEVLQKALRSNDIATIQSILKDNENLNVNTIMSEGVTPLIFAAKLSNLGTVKWLVENGADVNAQSDYKWTALMFAARRAGLTQEGFINATEDYDEAYDIAKYLIENGANINHKSIKKEQSWTASLATVSDKLEPSSPLNEAVNQYTNFKKDIRLVELLLSAGAKIDEDIVANTVKSGNLDIIKVISGEAKKQNFSFNKERASKLLFEIPIYGNSDGIKWLLENSVDVNTVYKGETIIIACINSQRCNSEAFIKYLIDKGAEVNVSFESSRYGRITPLSEAVRLGNIDLVSVLVEKGADVKKDYTQLMDIIKERKEKSLISNPSKSQDYEFNAKKLKNFDLIAKTLEQAYTRTKIN